MHLDAESECAPEEVVEGELGAPHRPRVSQCLGEPRDDLVDHVAALGGHRWLLPGLSEVGRVEARSGHRVQLRQAFLDIVLHELQASKLKMETCRC